MRNLIVVVIKKSFLGLFKEIKGNKFSDKPESLTIWFEVKELAVQNLD